MNVCEAPKHVKKLRVVDSITRQNLGWNCQFFRFGKASVKGVDYFNCGLVERPDGIWLIARRSKADPKIKIGLNDVVCFLLEDKIPVRYAKANIQSVYPGLEHFEDPRAIYHDGLTYISCCNFIIKGNGWTGAHQIVAAMDDKWNTVKRFDPVYGGNGSDLGKNTGIEKNWLLFWHGGLPHLIYQTSPHIVVRCNLDFEPQEVFSTEPERQNPGLPWDWGHPRGGTPPVRIGNEYWSFFHSSTQWRDTAPIRQYHMGAYAFEAKPPFRITKMTPEPLLSGSPFDRWSDDKPLVVFPNGSLLRAGIWFVSLGINDLDSAWIDIPHEELKERMVEV